jgi:hypothetical protein
LIFEDYRDAPWHLQGVLRKILQKNQILSGSLEIAPLSGGIQDPFSKEIIQFVRRGVLGNMSSSPQDPLMVERAMRAANYTEPRA